MNKWDDISNWSEDLPASLPRTLSTTNFSQLLRRRRHAGRKSRAKHSQSTSQSEGSEACGSENSQVLYMAPQKRSRTRNQSLSCISNGSARRLDGSSDTKDDIKEGKLDERLSWNIIDREISEWQYVCQTGRPYWWSPEAKQSRHKKPPPRLKNEPRQRMWMKEIDGRSKPVYEVLRRTVSESYLTEPSTMHDLAHLVAVQLLGACFTLPPDSVVGLPSPDSTSLDRNGSTRFHDPRMISSLRMHTNFRYSPSFGHQPRNTSPVQVWPGLYDGPSRNPSCLTGNTGVATTDTGASLNRSKARRPLHITEHSGSFSNDVGEFGACCSREELDSTVAKTEWHRREDFHDVGCRSMKLPHLLNSRVRSSKGWPSAEDGDVEGWEEYRGVQTSKRLPQTNYRLQSIIRSEPHHVFVQPVKELVVKRWRSFRRRFGGSLHSALLTSQCQSDQTSASDSGQSEVSSQALSSDAKMRRRRAQERGDIHSSSVDSTPHLNSPASETFLLDSSGSVSPYWVDSPNFTTLPLADTLVANASLVGAEGASPTTSKKSSSEAPPPLESLIFARTQTGPANSTLATCGSGHSKLEFPFPSSKSVSPSSSHSYSTRKVDNRNRRRSMLSEVCTPEDFRTLTGTNIEGSDVVGRSILSVVGSTLPSPEEDNSPILKAQDRRQGYQDAIASPSFAGFVGMSDSTDINSGERPQVCRTSSSGTQLFTPQDDGVELDGLPVGPERNIWASKGGRRERTYL